MSPDWLGGAVVMLLMVPVLVALWAYLRRPAMCSPTASGREDASA